MEEEMLMIFLLCVVGLHAYKKRQNRRWWIRPVNQQRKKFGFYSVLVNIMRTKDQEEFFKFTRMSLNQFKNLHSLVDQQLTKNETRKVISSEERLLITL